jgi:hypothetical protein
MRVERSMCAGEKKTIEYVQTESKSRKTCKIKIVDNTTGDSGELRSIIGPFTPVSRAQFGVMDIFIFLSKASSLSMTTNNTSGKALYHCEKQ